MKKERYFRDELRRLFMGYAIIPAVVFTAVCVLIFMAALIYGKSSGNTRHSQAVANKLEQVLTGYRAELEKLAAQPELLQAGMDARERVGVFEDFYQVAESLGCEADIYLLNQQQEVLLSSRQEPPAFLNDNPAISWGMIDSMDRQPTAPVIRLLNPWEDTGCILFGQAVRDGAQPVGYVVFTLDRGQFQSILDRADIQTIVADQFGWAYASNNYSFIDRSNRVFPLLRDADGYVTYERQLFLVSRRMVSGGLFTVYTVSDIQNIIYSLTFSGGLIISALGIMTVWVLISTKKVTENKTRDFYRILDVMEMAQKGNLHSTIQIESENEFRFIADAYNEMIISLRRQMANNQKMAVLVAAAQNKQLESQFNPHFLYNTLENIRYMCVIEPKVAQKMVFSLSNLLRYSMDGSEAEVTLREDLEHLENYLTILRYRFNKRLTYKLDVDAQVMDHRVPKLLLQPMIENSVKYGFGQQERLAVELKAYLHEGKLTMICRDDGVGIPQETLSELTALLEQEENKSRHSGLYNIHRRIRLLYGQPYGVEIRSQEGHGTMLVVTLPDHREGTQC